MFLFFILFIVALVWSLIGLSFCCALSEAKQFPHKPIKVFLLGVVSGPLIWFIFTVAYFLDFFFPQFVKSLQKDSRKS